MHKFSLVKYVANACALTLALISLNVQAADKAAAPSATREKVVFQVSDADPSKWNLALNNAKNVQDALGAANVDVEIVVYGPGIAMLKFDSEVGNRIEKATQDGIRIVACENTMKNQKLTPKDMLSTVGYVPAGVLELIKKQHEGYAYIRP